MNYPEEGTRGYDVRESIVLHCSSLSAVVSDGFSIMPAQMAFSIDGRPVSFEVQEGTEQETLGVIWMTEFRSLFCQIEEALSQKRIVHGWAYKE